jgi:hypothetical protein
MAGHPTAAVLNWADARDCMVFRVQWAGGFNGLMSDFI